LKRLIPGANPPTQIISEQPVALDPQGKGRTTFNIPAADLPDGTRAFAMRFDCTRPGMHEHGGADWITFNVSPNPVPGFTVGGSIAGLTVAGLELQNFNREILSVPAGSTSFEFGTPLRAGANYNIKVREQPVNQLCTVAHGSGHVAAAVSNIAVTCQSTLPAVQKLALVVNNSTNNMTILTRNTDSGRLTPLSTIATGSYPLDVAVTPNGQFAYVTNTVSGSVTSYRINGTTVTSIPQGTQYTFNPYGLTIDPNGQFLRVANYSTNMLSSYSIDNATGLLTARGSVPTGIFPYAVVTHPNGHFVYTIDEIGSSSSGPSISGFSVNPSSGELTSLGQPFSVGALSPLDLVISPNGAFIFAIGGQSQVARMSINAATGALTRGPTTTINFATGASCVAIHPTGSHLYVAASGAPAGFIQVFSVDGAGVLTATSQVPAGHGRICVAVDAGGEFIYVTNSSDNAVSTYSISQGGGALTLLEQDPTGTFPQAIALTP
jgi:6-phosphogluconolactonase (cycloisomerase 2 family)